MASVNELVQDFLDANERALDAGPTLKELNEKLDKFPDNEVNKMKILSMFDRLPYNENQDIVDNFDISLEEFREIEDEDDMFVYEHKIYDLFTLYEEYGNHWTSLDIIFEADYNNSPFKITIRFGNNERDDYDIVADGFVFNTVFDIIRKLP